VRAPVVQGAPGCRDRHCVTLAGRGGGARRRQRGRLRAVTFREVDAAEAIRLARAGYRVIDVREPAEWEAGHVAGAIHLPLADGTDNLDTRYLLNDAAVELRLPVVHGSVYRWDGQVTTFRPFEGPCYRFMHPVQPPPELAPDCDVAGVLSVLPGIVGTLQANEVLKLVTGVGEPLVGRLLTFDARSTTFDEILIPRDPDCPACGHEVGAALATRA